MVGAWARKNNKENGSNNSNGFARQKSNRIIKLDEAVTVQ